MDERLAAEIEALATADKWHYLESYVTDPASFVQSGLSGYARTSLAGASIAVTPEALLVYMETLENELMITLGYMQRDLLEAVEEAEESIADSILYCGQRKPRHYSH